MNYLEKACEMTFNQPLIMIIILNVFMIIASYTDAKSMKIYNKFNLTMLITRIISIGILIYLNNMTWIQAFWYLAGGITMFLMFLIPAMITLDSIGGDIKFAFNIGFYTGLQGGILIACIASISNLIFRIFFVGKEQKEPFFKIFMNIPIFIKAKKVLPLGPFFYFGYILLFIVNLIIN